MKDKVVSKKMCPKSTLINCKLYVKGEVRWQALLNLNATASYLPSLL